MPQGCNSNWNNACLLSALPCCPCLQVVGGTAGTRVIGNKLAHEEPQKPSDLPDELRHGDDHGANPPGAMSAEDKHVSRAVGPCSGRELSWACVYTASNACVQQQYLCLVLHGANPLRSMSGRQACQYNAARPGGGCQGPYCRVPTGTG